ncbi:MAG: alpha/beta fold hydrolase [Lachnospiraceae bacterium]|nr:alpha/beta fold hydrolase [Lachnospiraceae bacterium]
MKTNTSKRIKGWRIIIITLLSFILASFAMTKLIYDACFQRYDVVNEEIPEEFQPLLEERQNISLQSGKNKIQGYLYSEADSDALVVIAPGYCASADSYLGLVQDFVDYGWDVFIFDSTGSCTSEGKTSVGFSQELLDLDVALTYIEANYEYEDLLLFGHSRGGYSVCGMLGSDHDITAVVSVGGVNSAMEAVIQPATNYVGVLAYGNYPFLWLYQVLLFDMETVNIRADRQISNSEVPTLIIQGSNDIIVPMDKSSIYSYREQIESEHVEFILNEVPGQDGHRDILFDSDGTANNELMENINRFYMESMEDQGRN